MRFVRSPATPGPDATGTSLEPWTPDPAFEAAARTVCFDQLGLDESPLGLVFQDQRRADLAYFQFADDVKIAECMVRILPGGKPSVVASRSESIFSSGQHGFDEPYYEWPDTGVRLVSGFVPDEVAAVWVELEDGTRLRASLGNDHYVAWWLAEVDPALVVGLSSTGAELGRKRVWIDPSL